MVLERVSLAPKKQSAELVKSVPKFSSHIDWVYKRSKLFVTYPQ